MLRKKFNASYFYNDKSYRFKLNYKSNSFSFMKIKYLFIGSSIGTIIYYFDRQIKKDNFYRLTVFKNDVDNAIHESQLMYENVIKFSYNQKRNIQCALLDIFSKNLLQRQPLLCYSHIDDITNNIFDTKKYGVMKINLFKEKDNDSAEAKIFEMESKYAKERESLENEIKELRRQILVNRLKEEKKYPKMKKTLIEMYSEVLNELSSHDSTYTAQDHLPRVVVVGEQSAGKTSVLEMVAQARLFPRGSGTMMTRAPVKVTLSDGPYPMAKFDDEGLEFDLSSEQGQMSLRSEIERRMNQLASKTTISKQPISLSVHGPNLHRLVLVDLPGLINTVTTGMHIDAKDAVYSLAKEYMSNPNAIILCIQDGSKDAESSSIVDLVSSMDPLGKRTIFVLTKVDLAETQMSNPSRVRDILSGKVFQMKALGYFAVIAGRGNKEESILDIKAYEEQYFDNSRLFRDGAFQRQNLSTENLSKAVSDKFWVMVEEAVEQQCDVYKALRFNLETEWKHKFKGIRELDRIELFDKAKGEVLDSLLKFSNIEANKWQELLIQGLWNEIKDEMFENIFIPANQLTGYSGSYQTTVDIKLKKWVENSLPKQSIDVGEKEFINQLRLVEKSNESKSEDVLLFRSLKEEIYGLVLDKFHWDSKACIALKVIQSEALNDATIKSKADWDSATNFLIKSLEDQLKKIRKSKNGLRGPGVFNSWLTWSYKSDVQKKRSILMEDLEQVLHVDHKHKITLAPDEISSIRRNLQLKKIDVDAEFIKETWNVIYREHLYQDALIKAKDGFKGYYFYQNDFLEGNNFDYRDVTLFWRLSKMLEASSSAMRMQIINNENRRLEQIMKNALDDLSLDDERLHQLITGERANLAEELKRIRRIQEKLETFTSALKSKERSEY